MSKLDILNEGREQGILFAHKIAKMAAAEGKDPVEALEGEIKYRKRIQLNTLLTQKELDDACMKYKLNTIQSCLALSMIVLWDVFGFGGRRRLIRFMSEYKTYIDAFSEGSLTWEDILETLDTKCGIKLDLSDDLAARR